MSIRDAVCHKLGNIYKTVAYIFGCLERIEDKLNKQPVQSEQGENENNGNLVKALEPLVDSMNRTNRNLCVVRDALKIISDRQKKDKVVIDFVASLVEELLATVKQEIQTAANKGDCGLANEIHKLKQDILEQISKSQHRQVTHDLTTNTWWLVGVGIVLFFLVFFLTVQIYDQSKEIDRLKLSDWKYRALRATLPSNNVNVIWLERNVWRGNDKGIRQCQQFVIRSTSGRLARPRTTRTQSVTVIRWNKRPLCVTASDA